MSDQADGSANEHFKKRFAEITNADLQQIVDNKDAKNTKRATALAVKIFRDYLEEKSLDTNFENLTSSELDCNLGKFYAEARNKNGELYKKSTLTTIRYGLCRHFNSKMNIDIKKDSNFEKSEKIFKAVGKELKRQGLGGVDHYPPIAENDLKKAYISFDLFDPKSLQKKVFMDMMLYFGRRGRENLRELKITDFALTTDENGLRYIYLKRDELTKNHQEGSNTAEGHMYEIKDDDRCPVRTFLRYKSKLNRNCIYIFQRPSKNPKENCWYDNVPIGHNILGNMMNTISKECQLSEVYTNHSLRASTVHFLDVASIPDRHIMSVTGHKSQASLKTYTGYTTNKTKKKMSNTLSHVLRPSTCTKDTSVVEPPVFSSTSNSDNTENLNDY